MILLDSISALHNTLNASHQTFNITVHYNGFPKTYAATES